MKLKYLLNLAILFAFTFTACSKDSKTATEATKTEAPKQEEKKATEVAKKDSPAPTAQKRVYFAAPADGATVKSPLKVEFAVDGMSIRPAGEDVKDKTSGHHHLIIDAEGIPAGQVVPMDKQHIHYGKGQTGDEITLTPGKHTLRLQFADGAHLSYGPEMSSAITVTVAE